MDFTKDGASAENTRMDADAAGPEIATPPMVPETVLVVLVYSAGVVPAGIITSKRIVQVPPAAIEFGVMLTVSLAAMPPPPQPDRFVVPPLSRKAPGMKLLRLSEIEIPVAAVVVLVFSMVMDTSTVPPAATLAAAKFLVTFRAVVSTNKRLDAVLPITDAPFTDA